MRRYFEQQQKGSSFSSLVKTKTNFFLSLRSRESLLFFHQCECEYYSTISRFPGYLLLARSEFALRVTGVTHIKALLEKRKTIKNNNNTEHKYISSSSVTLFSQDLFVLSLSHAQIDILAVEFVRVRVFASLALVGYPRG